MPRPKGSKNEAVPIKKVRAENEKLRAAMENGCRCAKCMKIKDKDKDFYWDADPMLGGDSFSRICKDCAKAIALARDEEGHEMENPTKETAQKALMYLNRPFLDVIWNASVQESQNMMSGKNRWSVWTAYVKNMQMQQYVGLTYLDSDHLKKNTRVEKSSKRTSVNKMLEEHAGLDTYDSFAKNRADVVRLLDYDPFEAELVADQPFLYAQLLMLMDSNQDQDMDMIRVSSAIAITRGFLQISKLDDSIAKLMGDITHIQSNSATIKALQDAKQKVVSMNTSLAAESCLSLKNSKNSVRGENTWTGRIKKIKDLNLSEINGFDIATCKGMQQVQEISDASIMKQLALDDSDWSDMVAEMRETIVALRREKDQYKEINRLLLKENLGLKDTLEEKGIDVKGNSLNLKEVYSVFADDSEDIDMEDVVDEPSDAD
jgi:hypothetical protein